LSRVIDPADNRGATMLARYLKAFFWANLFTGFCGPLFLIIYFAMPSFFGASSYDDGTGGMVDTRGAIAWMLWVGLLITAGTLVAAVWLANRSVKSSAKSAALHQTGVLTTAQIMGLNQTGMYINERPVVNLNLHIAGPGFEFDTQKRVTVDITKQAIVTARKIVVWVDPNTHDYEIDWQASALIAGVVPAQFSSSEDHTTYDLSGQAGPLMEILQIYKANNLPFSGTVDIRNYPAVRQQIMDVVRRAAAQQQPAAAGGVAAPAQPSAAQRLEDLEKLHTSGALSDTEYSTARQKIIAEL
jgi:hypothetical protein